ncbi:MAG: hypothetical protein IJY61_01435 [Candidatus Gastranaerophilales bacterium]|nr:hypothetical protein [Candidatus Gastranaerophilales bacterium]
MRITPISFGKSVRVNGSKEQAYDIARLVNEKKVSKAERTAQKEAKRIFTDAEKGKVQVATYITPYNEEEVYLVSGDESNKLNRLNEQVATGIIQAGDSLGDSNRFNISVRRQMNHHNQKVRDLLLKSATNYDISATYDKSKTRVKSVDRKYDSVYAVAGTSEQLDKLEAIISKTKGKAIILDATDLYTQGKTTGLCANAAAEGKEISFVVTGKEACNNVSFMQFGWTSIQGISRRIQRFIDLRNTEEQVKTIQEAIEYDYTRGKK